MGVINPENMLQFKSSEFLFARIKKRLASFDADNLIDEGDFPKYVVYVLDQIGLPAFKECNALIPIEKRKGKLPGNFKQFHAAYKCSPVWNRTVKSINEQRPWIGYFDTEISNECRNGQCCFSCDGANNTTTTKVVIRTFINGEDQTVCDFRNPQLLRLSPNVRSLCHDECLNVHCTSPFEITVEDGIIHTNFDNDSIYLQYHGFPMDENGLPMIPDQSDMEKAIEYYIYTQLFEDFYWNSTVPNISPMLQDVRVQFNFFLEKAQYWGNLPSFQKMVNSIRRQRSRRKFFYFPNDRTIVR